MRSEPLPRHACIRRRGRRVGASIKTTRAAWLLLLLLRLAWRCDAAWDAVAWWDGATHAVPALLDAGVDAPVLRDRTQPVERLPTGIRALFSPEGQTLWAARDTCVLRADAIGVAVIAGDCAEPPYARDGASGFARFVRLRALVGDTQTRFAAVDDGGRLVAGDAWRTDTLRPSGARADALVLYSQATNDDAPQLFAVLYTDNAEDLLLARYVYRDGRWSEAAPSPDASGWPLLFCAQRLWTWTPRNASVLFSPEATVFLPDAAETPRLLCVDDAAVWRVDPLAETLTALTRPTCQCAPGEFAYATSQCAVVPPGAYASSSRLVPCPPGTFNPAPGGFRPEACLPCPLGTIAPLPGAVRCAACPRAAPVQGPLASVCMARCPDWTFNRSSLRCVACPEAGQRVWRQASCVMCPPMYAAPLGQPCVACPEGTASVAGASACSVVSDGGVCLPTGDPAVRYLTSTWAVYTTETEVEPDTAALAVAPNGTLWYVVADRLMWQAPTLVPPPDWALARTTLVDGLPASALLALDAPAYGALYLGVSNGSLYRIVNERALTPFARTPAAGLMGLTHFEDTLWALASGRLFQCFAACIDVGLVGGVRLGAEALALLLLQSDGRLLRWYPARPFLTIEDPHQRLNASSAVWRVPLVTGWPVSPLSAASVDGDAPLFVAPSAAALVDDMLFIVDAGRLRVAWTRGCECAPGHRMLSPAGACVPCPPGQHSAVGARACGVCPQGDFFDGDVCLPCPATLWVRSGVAEECTLLRSPPTPLASTRWTLVQALRIRAPLPYAIVCLHGAANDALGAFWQLSYAPRAPLAGDPSVARLAAPAIECPGHAAARLAAFDCASPLHYWNATRNGCLPCPSATWAFDDNATACAPRNGLPYACAAGEYLALAQRACRPCPYDTFSPAPGRVLACTPKTVHACPNATHYVYDDGRALTDNACRPCETQCTVRVPADGECNGRTYTQPYVCFTQLSPAGVRLRYTADARIETAPCPWPPEHAEWTQGPRPDRCYYRCLWANQVVWDDTTSVGLCPPQPDCPDGAYRDTPTTCAPMDTLPAHAVPSPAGGWRCADGWFARQGACVPCAPSSCAGGERFTPEECGGVVSGCAPCRNDWGRGITLLLFEAPGRCVYRCEPPMRPSNSTGVPCTLCGDAPPFGSACPPGQAWRDCVCVPCAVIPNTLLAPSFDAVCRVWCRPGFLTLDAKTLWPVADASQPQDPAHIVCQACSKQPKQPCPQCPIGTLAPQCKACVAPTCAPPTYASTAACPGGPAGPMPCLLCPTPGPFREWVAPPCVEACVRDAYPSSADGCTPCSTLPIPPGAPYHLYRALWNATPGARWWPRAYDPPHMRPRANDGALEARDGVCWPCATTTQTPYGGDPCGISTQAPTDVQRITIKLTRRLLLQSAPTATRSAYTLDRRRIEWPLPPPRPLPRNRAAPAPACAPGWTIEEPRHLRPRCTPCPRWASRVDALTGACLPDAPTDKKKPGGCPMALALPQPFTPQLCGCIPGTELHANRSACVRCPKGTVSRSLGNAPCVPALRRP